MKEYSIDQSPLFKCQQKKKLAKILGVKVSELKK
jgi:RNA-directed DNA polymerase